MGDNLPPGVTPNDIDKHFGGDPVNEYDVGLTMAVNIPARGRSREEAIEDAKSNIPELFEVLDYDVEVVEPK